MEDAWSRNAMEMEDAWSQSAMEIEAWSRHFGQEHHVYEAEQIRDPNGMLIDLDLAEERDLGPSGLELQNSWRP
ncbi:hypothetical protein MMC07_008900, partial [Pseudocyphellaria aurata]|nr:hypothetical protein [Pseudocyphellaria aurata]